MIKQKIIFFLYRKKFIFLRKLFTFNKKIKESLLQFLNKTLLKIKNYSKPSQIDCR